MGKIPEKERLQLETEEDQRFYQKEGSFSILSSTIYIVSTKEKVSY